MQCPHCGETVVVKYVGGRKPLNLPLNNIYDALRARRSVASAAQELGCSPAYIFGILKANKMKVKDVVNR